MSNKLTAVALVLGVVAFVVGGFALLNGGKTVVVPSIGANPGPFYSETQYFRNGVSVGGGIKVAAIYATTTAWDSGALVGADGLNGPATTSVSFILRQAGENNLLPGVGDTCFVGNESASSSVAESYQFKVTAVDSTSGFKNASATMLYVNYGPARDYGAATLNVVCVNQ